MRSSVAAALAAAVLVSACGKSAEENKADEAIKAAQEAGEAARQAGQAAQQAGNAALQAGNAAIQTAEGSPAATGVPQSAASDLQALAKGLEALASGGAATGSGERVEPVRFQDLIAMLPQVSGWQMEKPQGQRMTSPFPTASAEARYRSGEARVDVEIVDTANHQMLLAPIAMFMQAGYSQESTDGYEKSLTVNGQPGWEKWDISSKRGEVNALVGRRFVVTVRGNDVADTKVLQQFAQQMDFNALAALK